MQRSISYTIYGDIHPARKYSHFIRRRSSGMRIIAGQLLKPRMPAGELLLAALLVYARFAAVFGFRHSPLGGEHNPEVMH